MVNKADTKAMDDYDANEQMSNLSYYQFIPGFNGMLLMPPHDNMGKVPWVKKVSHYGLGADRKGRCGCCRADKYDPIDSCPQCKEASEEAGTDFKSLPKEQQRAITQKMRNVKYPTNMIDITPLIERATKIPKCFGLFGDKEINPDKCRNCPFNNAYTKPNGRKQKSSCEAFIQTVNFGSKIISSLKAKQKLYKDLFDLDDPKPIVIEKKGQGFNTEYNVEMAPNEVVEAVREFLAIKGIKKDIEENIPDLNVPELTKIATYEEVEQAMKSFSSTKQSRESGDKPPYKSCYAQYGCKDECPDCTQKMACRDASDDYDPDGTDVRSGKKAASSRYRDDD